MLIHRFAFFLRRSQRRFSHLLQESPHGYLAQDASCQRCQHPPRLFKSYLRRQLHDLLLHGGRRQPAWRQVQILIQQKVRFPFFIFIQPPLHPHLPKSRHHPPLTFHLHLPSPRTLRIQRFIQCPEIVFRLLFCPGASLLIPILFPALRLWICFLQFTADLWLFLLFTD